MRAIKRMPALAAAAVASIGVLGAMAAAAQAREIGAYTTKGAASYYSRPDLHPPKLSTDKPVVRSKLAAGGYFMTANFYNLNSPTPIIGQSGPLMLNNQLQPVWFKPVPKNVVANNLEAQTYNGRPVLTYWQGVVNNLGATVSGQYVVVNQHYQTVATLSGADGWVLSLHDFQISGHDAWVTAYKVIPGQNLTAYGGSANGQVLDVAVQEYDLTTGQLLKSWDALNPGGIPNIPLSQSQQKVPTSGAWDAYHINSIQLIGSNEFLVSMRNTWSAYLVNATTGQIIWTLSGNPKISSFSLSASAGFSWQHDVGMSGNLVTVFDDACCAVLGAGKFGKPSGPSRGLVLRLNTSNKTASLVAQYPRAKKFNAFFLGSTQILSNGNVLVGWGSTPYFTEFSKAGKVLLDVRWPGPDLSYRVFRQNWVGLPLVPPTGAARTSKGKTTVYASWNGATRVVAWRVMAGSSSTKLKMAVRKAGKKGFETSIPVGGSYSWFKVQALGSSGKVIGGSSPFRIGHASKVGGGSGNSTTNLVGGY